MPRICIVNPDICLTTEVKYGKTSVSVSERRSAERRRTRFFSRLGRRGRWPRLTCWPLPSLVFASGDGVNPRSAQVSAELPF